MKFADTRAQFQHVLGHQRDNTDTAQGNGAERLGKQRVARRLHGPQGDPTGRNQHHRENEQHDPGAVGLKDIGQEITDQEELNEHAQNGQYGGSATLFPFPHDRQNHGDGNQTQGEIDQPDGRN